MIKQKAPNSFSLYTNTLIDQVFNSTSEGIMITDENMQITLVNRAFETVTGYSMKEVLGHTPKILKSGRQEKYFYEKMWDDIKVKGMWQGEIWNKRKNGEIYPEYLMIQQIHDEKGKVTNYFGVFNDISKKKVVEQRLETLIQMDHLTNIPNRSLYIQLLENLIENSKEDTQHAIIFIDIDRFKHINESLGNDAGNLILKEFTNRLEAIIQPKDILARYAGDEFILTIPNLSQHKEAIQYAKEIIRCLDFPFQVTGSDIYITASIGISLFPQDGSEVEKIIQKADKAMYFAKQNGRNQYAFYFEDLKNDPKRLLLLEADLRKAIQNKSFDIFYQPKISLKTNEIIGVEALVRWNNDKLGYVSPAEFIPLAEDTGLIIPLSEIIIEKVCLDILEWRTLGIERMPVSINIASLHFQQDAFVNRINTILMQYNCSPNQLELELTERTVMKDSEMIVKKLIQLKSMGFKISIDDFGTGYSSLGYLNRFPINYLKIDRSFIQHITSLSDKQAIVESIILMAHRLQLKVVAEGVETKDQAKLLKQMDCDIIQGFYYSKPLPTKELMDFLELWEIHQQEGTV